MESPLLATVLVVIIVVLGGSEGFSVRRVAESYSGDEDSASTVNGTRVTDTLQHIVVVSISYFFRLKAKTAVDNEGLHIPKKDFSTSLQPVLRY